MKSLNNTNTANTNEIKEYCQQIEVPKNSFNNRVEKLLTNISNKLGLSYAIYQK